MDQSIVLNHPKLYADIIHKSKEIGFNMPSDLYIGILLKTLISSKPKAHVLELGTGIGLSLSWMIDGLDAESKIVSIDNDPELIKIVETFFEKETRLELICQDASEWIKKYKGKLFDLVFADAWPGKYSEIDELLDFIKPGGFYIIDDMNTQANWPKGHEDHVTRLVAYLENREDFVLTKMNWSTGVIVATKTK